MTCERVGGRWVIPYTDHAAHSSLVAPYGNSFTMALLDMLWYSFSKAVIVQAAPYHIYWNDSKTDFKSDLPQGYPIPTPAVFHVDLSVVYVVG